MRRAIPQILLLVTLVVTATPLAAQTRAGGRAVLQIDEIMSLQVRPGGGMAVLTRDGVHREIEDAVRLEVFANRPWQLHVVADAGAGVSAAEAATEVWWRSEGAGVGDGYRSAAAVPVLVASGPRGRAVVSLDYRWVDAPGRELEPESMLHFTLSAR